MTRNTFWQAVLAFPIGQHEILGKHKKMVLARIGDQSAMQNKANAILRKILQNLLITLPALLGFAILFFSQRPVNDMTFSLALFIAGFTGVIVAIRKEIPMSIGSIRGKWAVIQGGGVTILLWGSALFILLH